MRPKKTALVVFCSFLLLFITFKGIEEYQERKEMYQRCIDYDPYESMIDCYGILSIERSGIDVAPLFQMRDHKHNYGITFLNSSKQYRISGDYLFVKRHEKNIGFELVSRKYMVWQVTESGEREILDYDQKEDVPTYLKVDYRTGVVTSYLNYDQMPEEDKNVFQQLE